MNLYIHIPFCTSRCSYCHFYSTTNQSNISEYLRALIQEITYRVSGSPETIYFGGGTPSLLLPAQLNSILEAIDTSKTLEITLEANPNSLSKENIASYKSLGINRLSIGIQSWHPTILKHMNRRYDPKEINDLIAFTRYQGITNINLDHIIAYPMQTDQMLRRDILTSLSRKPSHISIYPLERHPSTHIQKSPTEKKIMRQFSLAQRLLIKQGYRHYEELNFCLPGFECRHNLDFWKGRNYLGIGASAVSRQGTDITTNTSDINEYMKRPTSSGQTIHVSTNQLRQLQTEIGCRVL